MSTPVGAPALAAPPRLQTLQRFEHEMAILVRRVRRVVAERARAIHPALQPAGYHVLARLVAEGAQRSSRLVEAFELDKGSVSRTVQHLVELGLVTRSPDPDDRRATLVSATPQAARRLSEVSRRRLEVLDARLAEWTDDDLEGLVAAFARYNRALEAVGQPAGDASSSSPGTRIP